MYKILQKSILVYNQVLYFQHKKSTLFVVSNKTLLNILKSTMYKFPKRYNYFENLLISYAQ